MEDMWFKWTVFLTAKRVTTAMDSTKNIFLLSSTPQQKGPTTGKLSLQWIISIGWNSDLLDKMKWTFFQAIACICLALW